MKFARFILILLMTCMGTYAFSQETRSSRIGFLLDNVPDSIAPVIRINSPILGEDLMYQTNRRVIELVGEVSDNETIRYFAINSVKWAFDENGRFRASLDLQPGVNELRLVAADVKNNLQEKFIQVMYNPPGKSLTEKINER